MIRWKDGVNVLVELSKCGYTAYELRKQRIFGEAAIQKLRRGGLPSWRELDFICHALCCDIGDLIEFRRETEKAEE